MCGGGGAPSESDDCAPPAAQGRPLTSGSGTSAMGPRTASATGVLRWGRSRGAEQRVAGGVGVAGWRGCRPCRPANVHAPPGRRPSSLRALCTFSGRRYGPPPHHGRHFGEYPEDNGPYGPPPHRRCAVPLMHMKRLAGSLLVSAASAPPAAQPPLPPPPLSLLTLPLTPPSPVTPHKAGGTTTVRRRTRSATFTGATRTTGRGPTGGAWAQALSKAFGSFVTSAAAALAG